MKQVIIQHGERFVQGFSLKTQRVYSTAYTSEAKRFSAVAANDFISQYTQIDDQFTYASIQIHLIKRGEKFNPYPEVTE